MNKLTALLGVGLALVLSSAAQADQIEALEGTYDEPVLGIHKGPKGMVVKTKAREIPLDTVKAIRFRRARTKGGAARLVLTNGDFIRGVVEAGDEDNLGFRSKSLGSRKISMELVRALVPGGRTPAEERTLLAKLKPSDEVDWVLLDNGGKSSGSIVSISAGKIAIDTDTQDGDGMGQLSFDVSKVHLVSIAPLGEEKEDTSDNLLGVALLHDGTTLRGELVSLDDKTLTILHPLAGGKGLRISRKEVAKISLQGGRFAYLSDLQPAGVEQRFPSEFTYEVDVWGFKRDRSVAGGPLRLGGKTFAKGLGVHSYCKLTYRLGKRYSKFKATIGLDDSVKYLGEPGFGGVVFRVLVDGKPATEYPNGISIKKGRPAQAIEVKLSGKQTLTLIADFDPVSLHVLGRANWADAHLIRD
ncbi:MAG: NPCBM/NEW2 domain-containing protein [Planctomycetes bacterium]|nr:NPCBM/NEW2 domain-containing protein [Planctomycetota bacterium]